MKGSGAHVLLLLMLTLLAACSPKSEPRVSAPEVPRPEVINPLVSSPVVPNPIVPSPVIPNLQVTLPAIPLWPEPGLRLVDEERDWSPGYAYAAFFMDGVELQPIATPDGYYYLTQHQNAVYLIGTTTERGGYFALDTPVLLYELPVQVGATWQVDYRGQTYRVVAVEKVTTPAGEQVAARIEVTGRDRQLVRLEWWVPGYGLVRTVDKDQKVWTPVKESRETPRLTPELGRPLPGMMTILCDDGEIWTVMNVETLEELFHDKTDYWRDRYLWLRAGTHDLLWNTYAPGSWAQSIYTAYLYDEKARQFTPIPWVSDAGSSKHGVGAGQLGPGGAILLMVQGYPVRYYTYQFDGTVLRSDPAAERVEYADSADDLVDRLNLWDLSMDDLFSMFEKAADGEQVYALVKSAPYNELYIDRDPEVENGYLLGKSPKDVSLRIQVALQGGQYKIVFVALP